MRYTSGSFGKGALIGFLVPLGGALIAYALFDMAGRLFFSGEANMTATFEPRTITLIGLIFNLIPFNYYLKRSEYNTVRGIILPTFVYAFAWLFYFWDSIFSL